MAEHPSKEELSGFLLGQLPSESCEVVAEHIEQCQPCQQTIHDLESMGDTLIEMLRRPAVTDDAASRQVIERIVAVVENTRGDLTQTLGKVNVPDDPPTNYTQAKLNIPAREAFERAVRLSEAIDEEEWSRLLKQVPALAEAKDAAELAKLLVQHGTLTKFQATLLYQGKSGLRMGEYIVLDQIGAGGMGQVFKARHRRMDRVVALKVLAKSAMNSPEAVKRFQREVKAAAKLNHSNIVTAHDAGEQDGVHFLVMEYVAGHDLSSLVKQRGPVPPDQVVAYIAQAARGLAFAHSKGVVHRDIKPANLLLDADGTVKILDMGLARLDGDNANLAALDGLTQSGQVMGTVDYMAPEQAFDTRTADAKADVYSLGCTVYRLITGRNVYDGETLVQKILAHREQPIPALQSPHGGVSPALEALYRRMMAKQPTDRPTMTEVATELESLHKAATVSRAAAESAPHLVVAPHKAATGGRGARGSDRGRRPPLKYFAAAAGAAALLFFGVWIIIRDKDGKTVAEIDAATGTKVHVPAGGSVEVATQPATSKPSTPSTVPADQAKNVTPTTSTPPRPAVTTSVQAVIPSPSAPPGDYALRFDGVDDRVELSDLVLDASKPFTIEAAVQTTENGRQMQIVSNETGYHDVLLALNPHRVVGIIRNNSIKGPTNQYSPTGPRTVDDARHYAAFVWDGKQAEVFWDGTSVAQDNQDRGPITASDVPLVIGARPQASRLAFAGRIDEVRISKVARYSKSYTPQARLESDADTLALYHFDEGTGDVLHDASGNKHDGKIVGATWVRADGGAISAASMIVGTSTSPGREPGDNIASPPTAARWNTPAFQQWLAATQKLPAEQQLAEFSKKLMELNPGFDGKLVGSYESGSSKPSIENGIVTGVGFDTAKVADISPVRVFSGLRELYCRANFRPNGHGPKGLLVDLSPLTGMPLTSLTAANSPIVDLSPLRGMQLKSLGIQATDVSDLTPLVGMPLEVLGMNSANKVTDLRPLRGMPLKNLSMNGLPIADLSPLVGMKLDGLSIASTQVTDLAVLRGMPLRWIDLSGTKVTDLAPLRDCVKLETVLLSRVNIAPAEISKLLQALPECKVDFSTPSGLLPETDALQEVDPERRVARWVLARGGTVNVSRASDERSRTIALEKDLPAEPFLVVHLKVPGSSNEISAAEWQSLGGLRSVRSIDVSGCRPTNEALAAIGRCRTLETLVIAWATSLFNDAGIRHLAELPHLRVLDLSHGGHTAASLESLGKLTSLRQLKMGTKDLQVTTLKPLQSLVHLHQLDLNFAKVSDQAVGELAALPQLRNLNLASSGLTPAVIDQLLKLRGLYTVSIEGLRLPAAALLKLADHPTLSLINTYGSGIKPEEYEQLAKALPRLTFLHPELQTLNAAELAAIDWAATVSGPFTGYDRQLREKAPHNAQLQFNMDKAFPPAEARQLAKVKNLTHLWLWEKTSSDEHVRSVFESLREFPHLLSLSIDRAQFKNAAALADLPWHAGLWSCELINSDGVGDASLAPLAKLPHLARVKLESSQLTDGVFEHLKPLQELEILSVLRAQQVTGSRLSELRDKPRLWSLQLSKTGVTDAALAALVEWPALEELSLGRTAISDVGLAHLAGCKNLRVLNVYGTKVTPAGIAALRKSLPECMVWHDSGIHPPASTK